MDSVSVYKYAFKLRDRHHAAMLLSNAVFIREPRQYLAPQCTAKPTSETFRECSCMARLLVPIGKQVL